MLKFYKAIALPMLIYGSECWAMNKADRMAVEAAGMTCLLYVAGHTRKGQISKEISNRYLNFLLK
jgi:hypothetical protein